VKTTQKNLKKNCQKNTQKYLHQSIFNHELTSDDYLENIEYHINNVFIIIIIIFNAHICANIIRESLPFHKHKTIISNAYADNSYSDSSSGLHAS